MANLPKGGGGMGNMGGMGGPGMMKMIADMKRKLEEDAVKMQENLDKAEFEGSAGGGVVKATANGHGQLLSLTIAPEAVDPDDVETLQDMVLIAVREALEKAEDTREQEQKKLMPAGIPGMNIPGLF